MQGVTGFFFYYVKDEIVNFFIFCLAAFTCTYIQTEQIFLYEIIIHLHCLHNFQLSELVSDFIHTSDTSNFLCEFLIYG